MNKVIKTIMGNRKDSSVGAGLQTALSILIHSCLLCFITFMLISCGSKKSPTGGPLDTVKPEVLATLPQEFGQLSDSIEITFSKAMDISSFTEGLYFYPPIGDKKLSYSGRTLSIRINEKLKDNTNYYLTLSTRIRDTRGNPLSNSRSYVFSSGRLNDLRLSGNIIYEEQADNGKPVTISLYSADSLLVLSHTSTGSTFGIEALNPAMYILKGWQDKDANGRFDLGREPWFEEKVDLKRSASLDLQMNYADTTLTVIRDVKARTDRLVELTLSKAPVSLGSIIVRAENGSRLRVLISELEGSQLTLITEAQDSLTYRVEISDLSDAKGNRNPMSAISFKGSRVQDKEAPRILSSTPRNGTSVSSLKPILTVNFNEIIPLDRMQVKLLATDQNREIPVQIVKGDSKSYSFQPAQTLTNYRSHSLIIMADTQDSAGNPLGNDHVISFLPLLKGR